MNKKIRLAQIFDVQGEYEPTKASVFLKRSGQNNGETFYLVDTLAIDATNFLDIKQGSNIAILNDEDDGFSGNGYMSVENINPYFDTEEEFPMLEFPITASKEGEYALSFRGQALGGLPSTFKVDILLDGIVIENIEETFVSGDPTEWRTISTNIVFPDTEKHILGIRLKDVNITLDKIVFWGADLNPSSIDIEDIPNSESPYITVHMQVYKVDNDFNILNKFVIYDFKNSLDDIFGTDWYNFNIRSLERNPSSSEIDFSEKAALVLSVSGSSYNNFIVWELLDNNEYQASPSAIKT